MPTSTLRSRIWRVAGAVLLLGACTGTSAPDWPGEETAAEKPSAANSQTEPGGEESQSDIQGLQFTVAESDPGPGEMSPQTAIEGSPLERAAIDRLVGRVEPSAEKPSAPNKFAFPSRSKPLPTTGESETMAFPPPEERERPGGGTAPDQGPLRLVRRWPEGHVDMAPHVSVTFSHPMVAIGAAGKADEADRPVELTPEVEGAWRWIGARTLSFSPEGGRLPMATEYEVSVAKRAESVDGIGLEKTVSWTFATPPVRVTEIHPTGGPAPRRPLMFMAFNQRIVRREIIDHIDVRGGGDTYGTHLISGRRIRDDERLRRIAEQTPDDQWVAFTVDQRLPAATTFQLGLAKGAPSNEGERRSRKAQHETFETHAPLAIQKAGCREDPCRATRSWDDEWKITFNNPLDPESIDASKVEVSPALPDKEVEVGTDYVTVDGVIRGGRTYRIRLAPDIRDTYGQRLGASQPQRIEVTHAPPRLVGPRKDRVTLDPSRPETFSVRSTNVETLRVRAFAVDPADWSTYVQHAKAEGGTAKSPGKKVIDRRVEVDAKTDAAVTTPVDLSTALEQGRGQVIVRIDIAEPLVSSAESSSSETTSFEVWVQSTEIGLDAYVDHQRLVVWATSLADGRPLEGVELSLTGRTQTMTTDAEGVASLRLPRASDERSDRQLVARKDGRLAMLPEPSDVESSESKSDAQSREFERSSRDPGAKARWLIVDSRQRLYERGGTLRLRGWLRVPGTPRLAIPEAGTTISYRIVDWPDNVSATGTVETDAHGGFTLTGETLELGDRVELEAEVDGQTYRHRYKPDVLPFERPSVELELETAGSGPRVVGEPVTTTAAVSHADGTPVRRGDIEWDVGARPVDYQPPGWSEFVFGAWRPWGDRDQSSNRDWKSHDGRLDAAGHHRIVIDPEAIDPARPHRLTIDARASNTGCSGEPTGTRQMVVHPAKIYVGLKTDRWFVEPGESLSVDVVASRIDGTPVVGRSVTVRARRRVWKRRDGEWTEAWREGPTCEVETGEQPVTCQLQLQGRGEWRISSTITDGQKRRHRTQLRAWVPGGARPVGRGMQTDQLQLVPRRETWEPGETAEVLVQAPFAGGQGLMIVERNGITETIQFSMEGSSHRLEVPVGEGDIPNLHLWAVVNGQTVRRDEEGKRVEKAPQRPVYATGRLKLTVSRQSKRLSVDVTPTSDETTPGGETAVSVEVDGPDGEPVAGSQVALVAIDEALLTAAGETPGAEETEAALREGPLDGMFPPAESTVASHHLRETVELAWQDAGTMGIGSLGTGEAAAGCMPSVELGSRVRRVAHFSPALETDADGRTSVRFELPDRSARYRLEAVAVAGAERFGSGESRLTVRRSLEVEPSAPRFLRVGDRAQLPVVVHNRRDEVQTVRLAVRTRRLESTGPGGYRVEVPANGRAEVSFSVRATSAGRARPAFVAAAAGRSATETVEFPIREPVRRDRATDRGSLEQGVTRRRISIPDAQATESGALEVTTSSTAFGQLTGALVSLLNASEIVSEPIASRIIGSVALRDRVGALAGDGLSSEEVIEETISGDLERLADFQQSDGGFALWKPEGRSRPFPSVHAAHAAVFAFTNDIDESDWVIHDAYKYMREIDEHLPEDWHTKTRNTVRAYALYVQQAIHRASHDVDPEKAERLVEETRALAGKSVGDELSVEAAGWVLATVAQLPVGDAVETRLRRAILERGQTREGRLQFRSDYGGEADRVMYSQSRDEAVVLEALLRSAPDSDAIPKLVAGLMDGRTEETWGNSQDNAFAILALERYFASSKPSSGSGTVDIWLGDRYVGEHGHPDETTGRQRRTGIPLSRLEAASRTNGKSEVILTLAHEGTGRIDYGIGMETPPETGRSAAYERGLAVERTYEPVDADDDVRRRSDGTWRLEQGARVRVRLRVVVPTRRHHVALVDHLTAGVEPLDRSVAGETIAEVPTSKASGPLWWWERPWFEYQNLGDERTAVFSSVMGAGLHDYTYLVRVTTRGEFIVPPPKAEELYHPETFGRGGTDRVVVKTRR